MSDLKAALKRDMIVAMKSNNKAVLMTVRSINALIKQFEVDQRKEADDAKIIELLEKARKQRLESIKHYQQANRKDLVSSEQTELELIESYLPKKLSAEKVQKVVQDIIAEIAPNGMAGMGEVMAQCKKRLHGQADMSQVSHLVKQALSSSK